MKYDIFTFNINKHKEQINSLNTLLSSKSSAFPSSWIQTKNNFEYLFLVGGDGTTIRKLNELWREDIKIVSINSGTSTFLGEELTEELINTTIKKEENFANYQLLEIEHKNNVFTAVNDVFIHGDLFLEFEIYINNQLFQRIRGFGLTISTQLGCTAINKSINGPIIWPSTNSFVLTPIFLQNNNQINNVQNPIVFSDKEKINIKILSKDFYIYIDNKKQKFNEIDCVFNISIIKSIASFLNWKDDNKYLKKLQKHFIHNNINN